MAYRKGYLVDEDGNNYIPRMYCGNLPKGEDTRDYWCALPQGEYWYGNTGNVPNMPSNNGFVLKFGFTSGDFSILFFTQSSGAIYRKSGNGSNVSGWVRIDGIRLNDLNTANTSDTWIPVVSGGNLQHTLRKFASGKTHTDYNNNQDFLPTMSFLSYWNGAYNSNNSSNLTYAYQGTIQCKPTTLYDNSSGSNGTITLSSNISNFSYIEILFRDDWNLTNSEMTVPGRPNVMLSVSRYTVASQTVISHYRSINLNGTTLSTNGDIYGAHNSWNNSVGSDNCIYVYKVIGWK